MSDLCRACSRRMFTCDIGACQKCGLMTSSGMFKLCQKCAIRLDQCASCSQSLTNESPENLDAPHSHLVLSNDTESLNLREWLDNHNLEKVTIDRTFSAIKAISITCSLQEAKLIEKAPGVIAISRED